MDNKDSRYQRAEQHYKDRMSIYENDENKIPKQASNNSHGQRRFNLVFILPVILIAVFVFPKIIDYFQKDSAGVSNPDGKPSVKEVVDYLEFSKSTESSTAVILTDYANYVNSDDESEEKTPPDAEVVENQLKQTEKILDELGKRSIPRGFEEYNEYQLYVLATDIELLKAVQSERTDEMDEYFNSMVINRNSLAGHRKSSMKAGLDSAGMNYTEKEDGSIDIEYFY